MKRAKAERTSHVNDEAIPTVTPPLSVDEGVQIGGIALREMLYREVVDPRSFSRPQAEPKRVSSNLEISGTATLFEDGNSELLLRVTVRPDVAVKPFEMTVAMSSIFKFPRDAAHEVMTTWINSVGILILYPYIREIISTTTQRGVYQGVHHDPMPIALLNKAIEVAVGEKLDKTDGPPQAATPAK